MKVCVGRGMASAKGGSTTIAYMYGRRVKTLVLFVAHIKYCHALRPGGGGGGGGCTCTCIEMYHA